MKVIVLIVASFCLRHAQAKYQFEFGRASYESLTLERKRLPGDEASIPFTAFDERMLAK